MQGRIDSFFKVLEIRDIVNVIWSQHLVLQTLIYNGIILFTISLILASMNFHNNVRSFQFVDLRFSITKEEEIWIMSVNADGFSLIYNVFIEFFLLFVCLEIMLLTQVQIKIIFLCIICSGCLS